MQQLLQAVLEAGPMASNVSRVKGAKLAARDFAVQSAITDVLKNVRLMTEASRQGGLASPLLDLCVSFVQRGGRRWGHGSHSDMGAHV